MKLEYLSVLVICHGWFRTFQSSNSIKIQNLFELSSFRPVGLILQAFSISVQYCID